MISSTGLKTRFKTFDEYYQRLPMTSSQTISLNKKFLQSRRTLKSKLYKVFAEQTLSDCETALEAKPVTVSHKSLKKTYEYHVLLSKSPRGRLTKKLELPEIASTTLRHQWMRSLSNFSGVERQEIVKDPIYYFDFNTPISNYLIGSSLKPKSDKENKQCFVFNKKLIQSIANEKMTLKINLKMSNLDQGADRPCDLPFSSAQKQSFSKTIFVRNKKQTLLKFDHRAPMEVQGRKAYLCVKQTPPNTSHPSLLK